MKFALSLAVILSLAMMSQAAIVQTINGISVDVTVDTVTPATGTLRAYVFSVSSAMGVYSVDGLVKVNSTAKLNQVWYSGLATPVQDPAGAWGAMAASPDKTNDTNVCLNPKNMIISRGATEDKGATALSGTYLSAGGTTTMAFGVQDVPELPPVGTPGVGDPEGDPDNYIPPSADYNPGHPAYPLNVFNYALTRVVVTNAGANALNTVSLVRPVSGPYVEWNFRLVDGTAGNPLDGTFDIFLTPAPEPMTLSLLAVGALALIRRRR